MTPIIEPSIGGRTIFIYEVEIEYTIVTQAEQADYDRQLSNGQPAEPPRVLNGAYIRLFDKPDIPAAIIEADKKFAAFVQGQAATIRTQTFRRCDLKFRGHAF